MPLFSTLSLNGDSGSFNFHKTGWTLTPSILIGAPTSVIPTIFMPDAAWHNPPNLSWLAHLVAWSIFGGLVHILWLGSYLLACTALKQKFKKAVNKSN